MRSGSAPLRSSGGGSGVAVRLSSDDSAGIRAVQSGLAARYDDAISDVLVWSLICSGFAFLGVVGFGVGLLVFDCAWCWIGYGLSWLFILRPVLWVLDAGQASWAVWFHEVRVACQSVKLVTGSLSSGFRMGSFSPVWVAGSLRVLRSVFSVVWHSRLVRLLRRVLWYVGRKLLWIFIPFLLLIILRRLLVPLLF